MELISIVVPVFNTGEYLKSCIDSLLQQEYTNIEIILVNDGSNDHITKTICIEYALKYNNIILVEQTNQGSAAARNTGIEYAKGKYIGFVDSDDVIEKNMYSELYKAIIKNNTKIVFCDLQIDNYKNIKYPDMPMKSGVYTQSEALHFFLLGHWHSACTSLYLKELFNSEKFPPGETNEDFILLFRLLMTQENIFYIDKKFYHYIKREGSNTESLANKKSLDWISHTTEVQSTISKSPKMSTVLNAEAEYQYLYSNIVMGNKIVLSNIYGSNTERDDMYKFIIKNLRRNFKNILTNKYLGMKKQVMGVLMTITPNLYMGLICLCYRNLRKKR
ncbi:glycosyltransferase family 2 protein [Peribacillus frigoritolerans]|uniref:glycosyltransferase family 2 protein n=1 Tax=Peribacillus castrilensis TaxID=2897690 RepID=UPI00296ED3B8|nr:glycosyltransferase [Peribacillus castrilensis]